MTTVTFFRGEPPVKVLRERVARLVAANKWLAGRLWKNESGRVQLMVPRDIKGADDGCFIELCDTELYPEMPYAQLTARLGASIAARGAQSLGRADGQLFKVALVRTQPGRFAVVVSMCHVIGDGATYYALLAALGNDEQPPALKLQRKTGFGEAMAASLGNDAQLWKKSPSLLAGILLKLLLLVPMGMAGKLNLQAWYVDPDWIQAEKETHKAEIANVTKPEIKFVSTNDVLTSWFLRTGKYSFGMMCVNFRGRLLDISQHDAGNYEGELYYWPDMFACPGGIRKPLSQGLNTGRPVPGAASNFSLNYAVVTNWASFPFSLAFPGCSHELHLPVFESKGILDSMIIFKPKPDAIGVLVTSRRPKGYWLQQSAGALSRQII